MYSKAEWLTTWLIIALAIAAAVSPLSAQDSRIRIMRRSFAESDEPRNLYNTGRDCFDRGQFAEAERNFREVMQRFPRNPIADRSAYYLIRTLARLGKLSDALSQITNFERTYPRSEWLNDVKELHISLTNQLTPAIEALVVPPVPPHPAPPAPPGPPVSLRTGRGRIHANAVDGAPDLTLQQEALRVLFDKNAERAIEIAAERLKVNPADPVALSNLHMMANTSSDKALPILMSIARDSSNPRARKDAIFWISRSHADKESLTEILVGLTPSFSSDDDSEAVVYALSQVNTPRATDALADMARDKNRSDRIRSNAMLWIAQSPLSNRSSILENVYKGTMDNPRLRRQLVNYIGLARDAQAVNVLENIASTDPDQAVRTSAVRWIAQIKASDALKRLQEWLPKK
jgi:HEAT repeat protein